MDLINKKRFRFSLLWLIVMCLLSGLLVSFVLGNIIRQERMRSTCCSATASGLSVKVISNAGGLVEFDAHSSTSQVPLYVMINNRNQVDKLVDLLSACNTIWSVDIVFDDVIIEDIQRLIDASDSIKRVRVKSVKDRDSFLEYAKSNNLQLSITHLGSGDYEER